MSTRYIQLQTRAGSYNKENRTVEFVLASGIPVKSYSYDIGRFMETLSMYPAHVRLDRLKGGAPVLDTHSSYDLSSQIGKVEDAWFENGQLIGRLQISNRDDLAGVRRDLEDGIITSGSVGFRVHTYQETTLPGAEMRSFTAVDWEPYEYSLVPIPADPNAKARSDKDDAHQPKFLTLRSAQETQESKMDEAQKAALAAEEKARAEKAAADAATVAERARTAAIIDITTRAQLGEGWGAKFISDGATVESVREAAFNEIAEKQKQTQINTQHIETRANGDVTKAIAEALYARMTNTTNKLTGEAREWAGSRMLQMGDAVAEAQGIKSEGRGDMAMVKRALHTTSNFPALFTQTVDRVLRDQLQGAARWFGPLAVAGTLPDFRKSNALTVSGFPDLLKLREHGEIEGGSFKFAAQSVRLDTFARMIGVTRQILVNDDLGAVAKVVGGISQAIVRLENKLVSFAYLGNPIMEETGFALFSAQHANLLTGAGSAPSVTAISNAKQALAQQKNLSNERLDLVGKYIVCGSALVDTFAQLLAPVNATTNAAVNIHSGKYEVLMDSRIDDVVGGELSWYMFTDPSTADVLQLNTLAGQDGPMVDTKDGWDILGMETRVVHDVGAGAVDYRGAVKSNGQ